MKTKLKCVCLILSLAAVFSSCAIGKHKESAEKAVERFHRQFNDGKFREIYAQSAEDFRKSTSEADLIALMDAVRRKLGTVVNATSRGWHVNANTSGTFVTVGYEVDFSEGKGNEQFVFLITKGQALLYNYNVNSPLLITR